MSQINYEFTFCYTNPLWINYCFHEFTLKKWSFPWIHNKFTIYCANSLWIHYLFCKNDVDLYFCHQLTMNSLSVTSIHYVSIIVFAFLSSFTQILYEFIIFFANIRRIHFLYREITMNSLSLLWNHYELYIFSRFHYFSRLTRITLNSLSPMN